MHALDVCRYNHWCEALSLSPLIGTRMDCQFHHHFRCQVRELLPQKGMDRSRGCILKGLRTLAQSLAAQWQWSDRPNNNGAFLYSFVES
ncbi:hypothetical protein OPV22_013938 [Ensete ventricosum]|uniref:Uncharacterized protein n=1 Tax=Ensete ventricosum TaxID=4639 RepID=A0AAV8QWQ2_ENSVE|nr:hypothetical protein OPV22_013938 [Ensete ventricosum]